MVQTGVIFTSKLLVVGDLLVTHSETVINSLGCRIAAFELPRHWLYLRLDQRSVCYYERIGLPQTVTESHRFASGPSH